MARQPVDKPANKIEYFIEQLVFQSRWLLVPLYIGLIVVLALFSIKFLKQVFLLSLDIFTIDSVPFLVQLLELVDKIMVANLVIMVLIGGYENSVSRMSVSDTAKRIRWLGKLDTGTLKIKLSTSIVTISGVHLLKIFMTLNQYNNEQLFWYVTIHVVFVVSAILLAYLDRVTRSSDPH